jgi:hypothetical protein
MAWALGSTVVLALTAVASAASPPHSTQHQIPEGRTTIRGPALDRPLELAGQPYFDLVFLAGLVPEWSPPPPGHRVSEPSAEQIGASYDVSFSFQVAERESVSLAQTLHFGTQNLGEVWVNTKTGQWIPLVTGGRLEAPGGWWRSDVLDDFLRAVAVAEGLSGFPPPEMQTTSDGRTTAAAPPASDPPRTTEEPATTPRVLLGLGALGLLLLIGALESRPGGFGAINPASE